MPHRVTLIPGDGIGPELAAATRIVVDASGAGIEWEVQNAGADVVEQYGTPLPAHVIESVRKNRVALKADRKASEVSACTQVGPTAK